MPAQPTAVPSPVTCSRPAPVDSSADLEWFRIVAGNLDYTERAVALYASDMPTARRRFTDEQIFDFVAQGVARLGVTEVEHRAAFSDRLGREYGMAYERGNAALMARAESMQADLWPNRRRQDRALSCSYQVGGRVLAGQVA